MILDSFIKKKKTGWITQMIAVALKDYIAATPSVLQLLTGKL